MKLTSKDIVRACCRAIYLWEFGDDDIAPNDRLSDKELFNIFSRKWTNHKKSRRPITYSANQLKALIKNCKIRSTQISNPNNPRIAAYLTQPTIVSKNAQDTYYSVLDRSNTVYSNPIRLRTRWEYGREFTKELAVELNARSANRRGGVQRAYASRILFFALPEIHIYNYSEPLINNLRKDYGLQGDTVDEVFELMNDLFVKHEKQLKRLPRPKFGKGGAVIKKGDWWERRVLDLAVLQNWHCFCRD